MIGGLDMNALFSNGAPHLGLGGYHDPSGLTSNSIAGPSKLSSFLSAMGKGLGGHGGQQQGGQPELPQQAQGPDIQDLLAQLFQGEQFSRPVGGQYANYLSQRF